MPFFPEIGRADVVITPVDALAGGARMRRSIQTMRHPDFPSPTDPGSRIRPARKAQVPRSAVPQYSRAAVAEGRVLRIDAQTYARVYGLTTSVEQATRSFLG